MKYYIYLSHQREDIYIHICEGSEIQLKYFDPLSLLCELWIVWVSTWTITNYQNTSELLIVSSFYLNYGEFKRTTNESGV